MTASAALKNVYDEIARRRVVIVNKINDLRVEEVALMALQDFVERVEERAKKEEAPKP